jgi:hypothetical protein
MERLLPGISIQSSLPRSLPLCQVREPCSKGYIYPNIARFNQVRYHPAYILFLFKLQGLFVVDGARD